MRELLGDADAAASALAAAKLTATKATLASSAISVTLSVKMLPSALTPARRRLAGSSTAALDSISTLLSDGTLTQRLKESGVADVDALVDSGALSVAAAAVEPSVTASPSATPSPPLGASAELSLGGLSASAFTNGALSAAAVSGISSAIRVALGSGCASCTVRVTRVVSSAGATVFTERRLAPITYTVSYIVAGSGAASAVAGLNLASVAAQLSTTFGTTITAATPASGAAAAASAVVATLGEGATAGISVAAVVVFALLAYRCWVACACGEKPAGKESSDDEDDDEQPEKEEGAAAT